ncbi:MAG: adenylate/guanylate cyclase domain-containing protein, partial [Nitrospirales bacterium]
MPVTAKFCFECGKDLRILEPITSRFSSPESYTPTHLAEKILQSRNSLVGERKNVTVLFCDLVKSSVLARELGHEAMHVLLNKFFELALSEIHRYEGTLNQFLGDGFMALFGAPLACEDHSHRAARAALGIQRAIIEHGICNEYANGKQVLMRIGLNTGPVVVGRIGNDLRMDYTAIGDTTNLAARLESLALPGKIYVSEQIHQRLEIQFVCIPIKARLPKGDARYVTVYQLQRERSVEESKKQRERGGISSPLIGRDSELEVLTNRLEQGSHKSGGV